MGCLMLGEIEYLDHAHTADLIAINEAHALEIGKVEFYINLPIGEGLGFDPEWAIFESTLAISEAPESFKEQGEKWVSCSQQFIGEESWLETSCPMNCWEQLTHFSPCSLKDS